MQLAVQNRLGSQGPGVARRSARFDAADVANPGSSP